MMVPDGDAGNGDPAVASVMVLVSVAFPDAAVAAGTTATTVAESAKTTRTCLIRFHMLGSPTLACWVTPIPTRNLDTVDRILGWPTAATAFSEMHRGRVQPGVLDL